MSLIVILKLFHFLALFFSSGLGVGHSLLFKEHQLTKESPFVVVQKTMFKVVRIGLVVLMLPCATGFSLFYQIHDSMNLGWTFSVKLLEAMVLLVTVIFINIYTPSMFIW